jgi:hypothetical protein
VPAAATAGNANGNTQQTPHATALVAITIMIQNLAAFAVAAVLEILGCFTFWQWLQRGASPVIAAVGILSLIGFALALRRVDAAFAGEGTRRTVESTSPHRSPGCGSLGVSSQQRATCSVPALRSSVLL